MPDSLVETPKSRPRAYSYLRFSTPEQMGGDSVRRQSTLAADYARRHELDLDEKLTFQDLGVSAFRSHNSNVGRLADFLEAVSVGQVPPGSFLLVESLDRISRDHAFDAQHTLSTMIMRGVTVVTLLDERMYSREALQKDPMGMMYSIMGFMRANEESAVKSRRLKHAWHAKRATVASRPLTSLVPAWLQLDHQTQKIVPIQTRAAVVRRIFDMCIAGIGQQTIASTLNSEGIEPWGTGNRKGVRWHRSYIAKTLTNPAVIGIMTPHEIEYRDGKKVRVPLAPVIDYFPAVVPHAIWTEAQALLDTKGAPRGRQAAAPLSNILARLATCPRCGKKMTRVQKGSRSLPSLVCSAAKVRAGCEYKSVRYETIERRLALVLPIAIRDRDGIEESEELAEKIAELEDVIHACREEIETIVNELLSGPSPALSERLRKQEALLPDMQSLLAQLQDHRDMMSGNVVSSRIERAIRALQAGEDGNMDRVEVNLALRGLFKKAIINWPEGTIDLEWHVGGVCRVKYGWTGGAWKAGVAVSL